MILSSKYYIKFFLILTYLAISTANATVRFNTILVKWSDTDMNQQANHHWTSHPPLLTTQLNQSTNLTDENNPLNNYDFSNRFVILWENSFIIKTDKHKSMLTVNPVKPAHPEGLAGLIKINSRNNSFKITPRIYINHSGLYYKIPFRPLTIKPGLTYYIDCLNYGLIMQANKMT